MKRIEGKKNINKNSYWQRVWDKEKVNINNRRKFYEQIIEWLDNGQRTLLEIGCATGFGLRRILTDRKKYILEGWDISSNAIGKAVMRYGHFRQLVFKIRNIYYDLPTLYDYILMVETLEHLACPEKIIDKCLDCCQRLIITVPLRNNNSRNPEHIFTDFSVYSFKKWKVLKYKTLFGNKYMAVMIKQRD